MTFQPISRILRSPAVVAAASAVAAVAALSTTVALANGDASTIRACVRIQTGAVRIVQPRATAPTRKRRRSGAGKAR